jgi:type II secretory pathway component PulJ
MSDTYDTSDMILPDGFELPAELKTEAGGEAAPQAAPGGSAAPQADGKQPETPPDDGTTTPGDGAQPARDREAKAPGDKAADAPKIKVQYNHEEKELTYDEAAPLIQKGMNYDKLQQQLAALQADPRPGKYERLMEAGKLLGFGSDDALLEALYATYYNNAATEQGLTPEQVRRETELRRREEALRRQEQEKLDAASRQKAEEEMYDRFVAAYPDVQPTDIKPETWARVRQGMDLTAAYQLQLYGDLMAENRRLKQSLQGAQNAKAAPVGSVTGHGSAEPAARDPFLMGVDSE